LAKGNTVSPKEDDGNNEIQTTGSMRRPRGFRNEESLKEHLATQALQVEQNKEKISSNITPDDITISIEPEEDKLNSGSTEDIKRRVSIYLTIKQKEGNSGEVITKAINLNSVDKAMLPSSFLDYIQNNIEGGLPKDLSDSGEMSKSEKMLKLEKFEEEAKARRKLFEEAMKKKLEEAELLFSEQEEKRLKMILSDDSQAPVEPTDSGERELEKSDKKDEPSPPIIEKQKWVNPKVSSLPRIGTPPLLNNPNPSASTTSERNSGPNEKLENSGKKTHKRTPSEGLAEDKHGFIVSPVHTPQFKESPVYKNTKEEKTKDKEFTISGPQSSFHAVHVDYGHVHLDNKAQILETIMGGKKEDPRKKSVADDIEIYLWPSKSTNFPLWPEKVEVPTVYSPLIAITKEFNCEMTTSSSTLHISFDDVDRLTPHYQLNFIGKSHINYVANDEIVGPVVASVEKTSSQKNYVLL